MCSETIGEEIREQKSLFGVNIDEDTDELPDDIRQPKSLFDFEVQQGGADMQTLGLCDEPEKDGEEMTGFWQRQFQGEPTRRQKQYDWLFGVIMPVVCIFSIRWSFAPGTCPITVTSARTGPLPMPVVSSQ